MYQLCWSSGKILACYVRGPEFKSRVLCLLLFQDDILGSLGSNLFYNSFWDYIVPDRIP